LAARSAHFLIELYKGAEPDIPSISSDIGMLQVCRANGRAGSIGRTRRVGALFVTVVYIDQVRAEGIRLHVLKGARFGVPRKSDLII
jgi:hypothetical protein